MKKFPLLLLASLAGNIALAVLVLNTAPGTGSSGAEAAGKGNAGTANGSTSGKPGDANAAIDPALWSGLASGDSAALVARLRAAGFPPSLVRAIVAAQVNESFAARRKALQPPKGDSTFWKADRPADAKTLAALRELGREQTKVMKDLLGKSDQEDDPMYAAYLRRQYGDLPGDKVDQLKKVTQDYGELRNEIYSAAGLGAGGGAITLTPDDRAKLALLEKAQRDDIRGLLSPKEFDDYELRSSNTADQMRYQLSAFNPTEEEFRTIFAMQRTFDDQYRTMQMVGDAPPSQEAMRQRMEAQKQLTDQIKASLGPERGAEYERAIDGNFQQISRVVERLELPKDSAVQVWNLQKDIQQRANAINSDRTLPVEARNEQLAALSQEATSKVTSTLGQRGFDVYKQYGGYWLQSIQPRPATAGRAPVTGGGSGQMILVPAR